MTDLRLAVQIQKLPLFARVYRSAFTSGSGAGGSKLKRFASRVLYYLFDYLLPGKQQGVARLTVRGVPREITFDCRNRQFNVLYFAKYAGGYEIPVAASLRHFLRPDSTFYDVGSNWGYHSVLVASDPGFEGQVHAFEPWPASFRDLEVTVEQTGLSAHVVCHELALGDMDSTVFMNSPRHSGLAKVNRRRGKVRVSLRRVDDLDLAPPDVMKVDAEGFELSIFQGAAGTLDRYGPVILFENSRSEGEEHLEPMRFLEQAEYRLYVPVVRCQGSEANRATATGAHDPAGRRGDDRELRLHPVTSATRGQHSDYINLLAVPEHRAGELADRIIA